MKLYDYQQEVTDLLKTSKVDANGHLLITLELYNTYYLMLIRTSNKKNQEEFSKMRWMYPTKFKTTLCNLIGGSYQSVTKDFTPITTVCIEYLGGSLDYVNVK
jgi:hypothetical protein